MRRFIPPLYGLLCYGFFLATFLYAIGLTANLVVPTSVDVGTSSPASSTATRTVASTSSCPGLTPPQSRKWSDDVNGAVSAGTQGLLAISRGADLRPLLLIASPLKPIDTSDALDACDQIARGVVFISDPERTDNPTVESLRRAFELTYREAQIAIAIAHGHGLQAAADARMGVALRTARSQLQQAFAKTGTRHQAEFAALGEPQAI